MKRAIVLFVLLLTACGDEMIDRSDACQEQADYWCGIGGVRADRCAALYVGLCSAEGDEQVGVDGHVQCLDELAETAPPWTWDRVPAACVETWR